MNNIVLFAKTGRYIILFACLLELVFFPALENLCGCAVSIYGWLLFESYVFKLKNFKQFFIPTVAITGYIIMYFFLPLIMTLVEIKPLTYNFEVPYTTFFNQFINVNVIILAFICCKKIYHPHNFFTRLWCKLEYFKPPSDNQLWVLSIISLVLFVSYQFSVRDMDNSSFSFSDMQKNAEGGGVSAFLSSVSIYFALPICLFFKKIYGSNEKNKRFLTGIVIYAICLLAVALLSTRRAVLVKPFFSMVFLYFLLLIMGNKKINISFSGVLKYSIVFLMITGPLADLAIAMVLSRGQNKSIGSVIEMLYDRDKLHSQYNLMRDFMSKGDNSYSWSENYVNNVLLDRFCNLKVQDATIFYANKLGYNNPKMHEYMKDKIMYKLPTIVVETLGEKKKNRTTPTDLMLDEYLTIKDYIRIGNMVSGDTGAGLYWLGYYYYPVAFIIYILSFYFLSTLVFTRFGAFLVPVPVICFMQSYFMFFGNGAGIITKIEMLIRDGWSNVLIYCIFFFIIRKFVK